MKTAEQMLKIANTMIAEGTKAKEAFMDRFSREPLRTLDESATDRMYVEMAKLEFGQYLHGQVAGKQTAQYDLIIESLEGFVISHSTTAADHSSSESSNMVKRARLQACAQLVQRLKATY
jgi:hypothetical protein